MYYPTRSRVAKEAHSADLQESREMAFPFGFDPDGKTRVYSSTQMKLAARVTQLLLTGKGERRMRSTYGTEIRRLVFQGMDRESIAALLTSDMGVMESIRQYCPEIQALSFDVKMVDMQEGIVQLDFVLKSSGPDMGTYRAGALLA